MWWFIRCYTMYMHYYNVVTMQHTNMASSVCPFKQAIWKGVSPYSVFWLTAQAPFCISSFTVSWWLFTVAQWMGASPHWNMRNNTHTCICTQACYMYMYQWLIITVWHRQFPVQFAHASSQFHILSAIMAKQKRSMKWQVMVATCGKLQSSLLLWSTMLLLLWFTEPVTQTAKKFLLNCIFVW